MGIQIQIIHTIHPILIVMGILLQNLQVVLQEQKHLTLLVNSDKTHFIPKTQKNKIERHEKNASRRFDADCHHRSTSR